MQKIKAAFLLLCCVSVYDGIYAQNEDSLVHALQMATHDTARIKILSALTEACSINDILKYAEPAKALCEKAIAAKLKPDSFYLSNLGGAINNIGYYYSKRGDPDKALSNYKESLKIFEQINDKKTAAYQLNNIAFVYGNRGDIATALEYFYKNLKVQEEIKDTIGIAYSLNNIAHNFSGQQDYKTAMEYFSKSLKMFEAAGAKKGMAMVFGNMGIIYTHQQNKEKALEYYNKSLLLFEEMDDKYSMATQLACIGHEYNTAGEETKALDYLNRALQIAEKFKIKEAQCYALADIAGILFKNGNIDTAQKYAVRSLQMGKELGNPNNINKSANLLKEIYTKKGNYKDAFEMYNLEIQMRDSVLNQTTKKAAITKDLQYQYEKKELQLKLDNERKIAWKNNVIFASLSLAAIIFLLSFFYVRQNKLKAKLERMELEQQQYRSQMNPHFIFNCLNSIQHYIVHNDVIAANKYLSEFASLMRKTLENNKLHTIALQQEIEYLNSYLTLEQMRFENKFTYEINCAPDVNVFDTQVLPTLIQPFAENAIVHGLCFLEKGGRLLVSFEKEADCILCRIDDNGIGRAASQGLKSKSRETHVSQGMELIKKRLALASTINNKNFGVEIIDKTNAEGQASGTLVIIKFPMGL